MRSHRGNAGPRTFTRRQLLAAGAVTGLPLFLLLRSGNSSDGSTVEPTTPSGGSTSASPDSLPPTTTATAPARARVPPLANDLGLGTIGGDVEVLQTLLRERAFDPGPVDGYFGESTLRSVWAFEKLIEGVPREEMTGKVTESMWADLHNATAIEPRRLPGGTHLEVYIPEQVAVLFVDGAVRLVSHVSSGEGIEWCDEVLVDNDDGTQEKIGICGRAVTPGGVYHFERKVEGWRNAKLGRLYKPTYFNFGIAIHGASNVPEYPASRGCVRFPMHIADYLQDLVSIGDAVYVFDGVEDPETYGAQPMIFDWADPDYTTTTSSTSTTTPATTAPPTTTPAAPVPPSPAPPHTAHPTTVPPSTAPPTTAPPTTVPPAAVPPAAATG